MDAKVPRWVKWLPRPGWGIVAAIVLFYLLLASAPGRGKTGPTPRPFMVYEQNGSLVVAFTRADPKWSVAELLENSPGARVFTVFVFGQNDTPFEPGVIFELASTRILAYSSQGFAGASWQDIAEIHEALYRWSLNTNHIGMISDPRAVARISWPGVAFNVLLLVLVLTVPLAIVRFVYETRTAARERVWIERLRRGVCPKCEYSIAGLQREACPECGEFIPRDAIAAATDTAKKLDTSPREEHGHKENIAALESGATKSGTRTGGPPKAAR